MIWIFQIPNCKQLNELLKSGTLVNAEESKVTVRMREPNMFLYLCQNLIIQQLGIRNNSPSSVFAMDTAACMLS